MRKRERAGAIAARNIERLRVAQGIAAGALSERAGLARAHVGKIVRGKINPGVDTLDRIASALGVSLGELLTTRKKVDAADAVIPSVDPKNVEWEGAVIYDAAAPEGKRRIARVTFAKKGGGRRDVEGRAGAAGGAVAEETGGAKA